MPHRSSFPSIDIPMVDLWSFLFERADAPSGDTEIFVEPETARSYTLTEIKQASIDFGNGLKSMWDWKKGDVLGIYSPNCIDIPVVTCGLLWAGGVPSPANPLYTVDELAFQMKDAGARAIVTQTRFLKTARAAAAKLGISEEFILLIGTESNDTREFRHFTSIKSPGVSCLPSSPMIDDPRKDLAFLVYSSGTTGHPKGVMLSHHNIVANLVQLAYVHDRFLNPAVHRGGHGDKQLAILPFFHIYGLVAVVLTALYRGFQTFVMGNFDLEKACQYIQNSGITFLFVPPPVVLALGKHPVVSNYDLSTLKVINSGGAPLSKELIEVVWRRLTVPVKQGYGLSEMSPVTHFQTIDDWAKYMGSIGKLVPNMEARVVDSNGLDVGLGQTGELWVRGPNKFLGYHNRPGLNEESFAEDGYYRTGDIVYCDKRGNFYVTDRLKELIKYSMCQDPDRSSLAACSEANMQCVSKEAFQVPPAELEGILISHKHVRDSCVIGIEDKEQATELPRAYIVLEKGVEGNSLKAREIMDWINGKVAPHKRLRGGIKFIDEIPKTASGKILRRRIKDMAMQEEQANKARL